MFSACHQLSDNHGGTACHFMLSTTKDSCSQNDNQRFLITDNFCNSWNLTGFGVTQETHTWECLWVHSQRRLTGGRGRGLAPKWVAPSTEPARYKEVHTKAVCSWLHTPHERVCLLLLLLPLNSCFSISFWCGLNTRDSPGSFRCSVPGRDCQDT